MKKGSLEELLLKKRMLYFLIVIMTAMRIFTSYLVELRIFLIKVPIKMSS